MKMKLDISVFSGLPPGPIPLRARTKRTPPQQTDNPLRAIVVFARYMGMKEIPARTVEKLRNDPYFRYCFYQFASPDMIYDEGFYSTKVSQANLLRLLKDPDSMTDEDLYLGLKEYLNNFVGYMPGGHKYQFLQPPKISRRVEHVIDAVNRVLREKGNLEKAKLLAAEIQDEKGYAKRAEFWELSLAVFNILVERYKFNPDELWK